MSIQADPGHGNSPAAWATVTIMLVAISVGTLAFWFEIVWAVYASVGLLVVGALVGWAMAKAGYGVAGPKYMPKAHS